MTDTLNRDDLPPQARSSQRSLLRWLIYGTLGLLLALGLLLYFGMRWLDSPSGRAWLIARVNASDVVKLERIDGPIWRDVTVSGIAIETKDISVKLDRVHLIWEPYALFARDFSASLLDAGTLVIRNKPKPPKAAAPTTPLAKIDLPLGIHIDDIRVARLQIVQTPVDLRDVHLSLSSNGNFHRLELKQLLSPHGRASASLQLEGKPPFKTAGWLDFSGRIDNYNVAARYTLAGSLRELLLKGRVSGDRIAGELDLRVDAFAPYAYNMLKQARLRIDRFDPAAILPNVPHAQLGIRMDLAPTGADTAHGALVLTNAEPMPVTQHGMPFSRLEAEFDVKAAALDLTSFNAQLLGDGLLKGKGQLRADQLNLLLTVSGIDLARLVPSKAKSRLAGTIKLMGPYQAPNVQADLSDTFYKAQLKADLAWLNPTKERRLAIRRLELTRGKSTAKVVGELGFDQLDFKAEGQFAHFNPADFLAIPAGELNGYLKATGALKSQWQAQVDYRLATSRYNGQELAGAGKLKLADRRLFDTDLWLKLGDNRIDAKGALGREGDRLALKLGFENLAQVGKGFGGQVHGDAQFSGLLSQPLIVADLAIDAFNTPFGMAVQHGQLQTQLYPDLSKPLKMGLVLDQAKGFGAQLDRLELNIDGTRAMHRINLTANGKYADEAVALNLAAVGALAVDWQWRGRIDKLEAQGPLPLRLLVPVEAELGAKSVKLAGMQVAAGESRVHIDRLNWQAGRLDTAGTLSKLVVAEWVKLAGIQNLDTDLALSGRWQITQTSTLDGVVELTRSAGDAGWRTGEGQRQAFNLDRFNLKVTAVQSRVALNGELLSSRFGTVNIVGDTIVDAMHWQPANGAPLNLKAEGSLPDLSKVAPLFGNNMQLAGRLQFNVQRSGPFDGTANLTGTLEGDGLMIKDGETGISLADGTMRVRLQPKRVVLDMVKFRGGQGSLSASGTLEVGSDSPVAQASIVAQKLTLINKPDMLLIVSGKGNIGYGKDGLSVTGQMQADQGDIYYRSVDVPKLSDDVVVVGQERKTSRGLPLTELQFDVDLGENFHFRGYGLEADLVGKLGLRAKPGQTLSAYGQVKIAENSASTYKAYGQKLDIERGVLNFAGPVENPGLDILAMRRGLSVEAGVAVKGTVLSPRVTLYSEPNVSDNEKLAWLLFGHGTDAMDKGDSAVLAQLLTGVLSGGDPGSGFTDEILGGLGVDEIGMATNRMADGTSTQVVSVSKRLSRTVRLSLEKSLNGLTDAIKLSWQFSKRWSLVSRFGVDESTLDATYTLRFD